MSVADVYGERRKPVVFNLDREEDRTLYAWASAQNFSRLVKNCLLAAMAAEERERLRGLDPSRVSLSVNRP